MFFIPLLPHSIQLRTRYSEGDITGVKTNRLWHLPSVGRPRGSPVIMPSAMRTHSVLRLPPSWPVLARRAGVVAMTTAVACLSQVVLPPLRP